jgi:error-prone DNA polymerase
MVCLDTLRYAELHALSPYSFQRGASSAQELFQRAAQLGYSALAITDECSLAGIVRAQEASEESGVALIVGSEMQLRDGPKLVLLVTDQNGYSELCRLITQGRRRSQKGEYELHRADLENLGPGILVLWCPPGFVPVDEKPSWAEDPSVHVLAERRATSHAPQLPPSTEETTASFEATSCSPSVTALNAITTDTPETDSVEAKDRPAHQQPLTPIDEMAAWVQRHFHNRAWIAVELHRNGADAERLEQLQQLGARHGLPLVASGDVHMHARGRRALQDTLTAIRLGCTLAEAGYALFPNGERHLRRKDDLATLYPAELLAESVRIAERCNFNLRNISYVYPHELVPAGCTAIDHLRALTFTGAHRHWPQGIPADVEKQLNKELRLIETLRYEHFFLTVEDIVRWARTRNPPILCQGRGSSANSAVCFCLGITSVDPEHGNLLFERFLSIERNEPPDIDVDFEHERREEVIQYVFRKYGRERAALAATVIRYRSKSAARDIGRALGLAEDQLDQLSHAYSHAQGEVPIEMLLRESGFDPDSRVMRQLRVLVNELRGFPRHLSQHVGGFVISEHPLHTLVPVENASMAERTIIQWDKDDLESMKLLKVDCLALGMLTCIRKALGLLREHHGIEHDLASIPSEDPTTYEMIRAADTIGVFQIESRAQMSMLPRLQPKTFYDLVVQIAIVRPGPIQGGMVHPYLRRRQGLEPIEYPQSSDEIAAGSKTSRVESVLSRTLGIPIFQEQVMKLVEVVAGFTPGRADALRRAMAAWKRKGGIEPFRDEIRQGMLARGYSEDYFERIFEQIKGFGDYGFPESHSASFARLAYASSWLKCHYPAIFTCALLNSLPMGFYGPAQLIRDARNHGVRVLPIDVLHSEWDCTLERVTSSSQEAHGEDDGSEPLRLRLGFSRINGMPQAAAMRIVEARKQQAFCSISDLVRRAQLDRRERACLADADALRSLSGDRHHARWDSAGIEATMPLFEHVETTEETIALDTPSLQADVFNDYASQGFSLRRHPLALIRERLNHQRILRARDVHAIPHGRRVRCAGLVTVRQRPGTAKGVTFLTIEDETGVLNIVVWQDLAIEQRRELLESVVLGVEGVTQSSQGVRHVIAQRLFNVSELLPQLSTQSRNFH